VCCSAKATFDLFQRHLSLVRDGIISGGKPHAEHHDSMD
jgi:hypothetical protein